MLTGRQPCPHFSFMLFYYLCFNFTFEKSCFLTGILAQASQISLRRVEWGKVRCSLESSRSSEFDDVNFDFPAWNLAQESFTLKIISFFPGISLKRVKFPEKKILSFLKIFSFMICYFFVLIFTLKKLFYFIFASKVTHSLYSF